MNGLVEALIHGKPFVLPVDRGAEATQLASNCTARLLFPFPYLVQEGVAAQVVTGLATFRSEFALDDHLGGNTCVIGSHLPQRLGAFHALIAGERIHDRILKRMPHVKAAGDIGRWDHDAVGRAISGGGEIPFFLPGLVPLAFNVRRLKCFIHGFPFGDNCWAQSAGRR